MQTFKQFLNISLNEGIIESNVKEIIDRVNKLKEKIVDKNLSSLEIIDIFNEVLTDYYINIEPSIEHNNSDDYSLTGITHGGLESNGNIKIYVDTEIFWETFEDEQTLEGIDQSWDDFVKIIGKYISHEMIHRKQISKMKINQFDKITSDNLDNDIKYLSNKQEMMALADGAIQEMIFKNYSKKAIEKILKNSRDYTPSDILTSYFNTFETNSPKLKRFLKYCYEYLNLYFKER